MPFPSLKNHEDGFTLVELLIVVVIIGILAAIAIPIFVNQQKAAYDVALQSDLHNFGIAMETTKITNNGKYDVSQIRSPISSKSAVVAAAPNVNNWLVCSAKTGESFAVYARSASGNTFLYRSGGGFAPGVIASQSTACPAAGYPVGTFDGNWGYEGATATWSNWLV